MSFKISDNESINFQQQEKLIVAYSVVVIRKLRKKILQFSISEFEFNTGSICVDCYAANANQESGQLDKSHGGFSNYYSDYFYNWITWICFSIPFRFNAEVGILGIM